MNVLRKVESVWKKQTFYDELKGEWDVHRACDLFMCLGDINGHIGSQFCGCIGVHEGYDVGEINLDRRMLLVFCLEKELCVSNTWFKRGGKEEGDIQNGRCHGHE